MGKIEAIYPAILLILSIGSKNPEKNIRKTRIKVVISRVIDFFFIKYAKLISNIMKILEIKNKIIETKTKFLNMLITKRIFPKRRTQKIGNAIIIKEVV